ncbi:hypothetical protein GE107_07815 [Cohnella sp. CFH 77786]|uniref:hypothetical protein n=1 Tax=Cohnella sp. CFH 77786 TaxID=2662265 RepID=UPI001C60CB53|nr:hypothetical protein [Cohnella sp. CFH 77786]MBW5445965.1 hypothetical protein [Cohnella sp. CFH 77786]
MSAQGEPLKWADLLKGTKIRAYYGPAVTKSIPPQVSIDPILLDDTAASEYSLSCQAAIQRSL